MPCGFWLGDVALILFVGFGSFLFGLLCPVWLDCLVFCFLVYCVLRLPVCLIFELMFCCVWVVFCGFWL